MRMAVARKGEPEAESGPDRGGMPEPGLRTAPAAAPEPAPAEEVRWLAEVAAGNAAVFRQVVARHLPHLLATARRILRDGAEAEDIAQEAMVRLWRTAGTLELGPGGLKPWLRRVVSNLCIDRLRAGRRLSVVEEVPEQIEPASQLRSLDERELTTRVGAAVKALPERQRLALTLFHYEGLSQFEVGSMLGISDEAVESLLARARRALKAALKNDWQQLLPDDEGTP